MKIIWILLGVCLAAEVIEWGTIISWIATGIWWPFAAGMPAVLGFAILQKYFIQRVTRGQLCVI